ncbi:hypothetical protein IPZ58_33690 [Streptomyces roseoverticillatus]|uniref:hypothetical protein n=1 Tax=Streptomyces roseoverticillatus TaxID=66429 RepID=UPI001F35A87C|nr:hypothetical protein [Streptomyces roseoverticillatus]MCF3106482.1 hypothetical protein [Streptomyces roseoverticillatus]
MAKGDKAKSKAEKQQEQAGRAGSTGKKAKENANDKARQELIRKEQEEWDRRDTFDENFEI